MGISIGLPKRALLDYARGDSGLAGVAYPFAFLHDLVPNKFDTCQRVEAVKLVAMRVIKEEVAQVAVERFKVLENGGELQLEDADKVSVGELGEVEQNRLRLLRCWSGRGSA